MDSSKCAHKVGAMQSQEGGEERRQGLVAASDASALPRGTPSSDYENMPEWHLDRLLSEYGSRAQLRQAGEVEQKRSSPSGLSSWPPQH
ncbi:uncharacterized protein J3R85_010372 [Psidium guajava]|nr:uncharacterized protein J3R85_010372 [Psidium guajava]